MAAVIAGFQRLEAVFPSSDTHNCVCLKEALQRITCLEPLQRPLMPCVPPQLAE